MGERISTKSDIGGAVPAYLIPGLIDAICVDGPRATPGMTPFSSQNLPRICWLDPSEFQ
jgi:hypothetical protein